MPFYAGNDRDQRAVSEARWGVLHAPDCSALRETICRGGSSQHKEALKINRRLHPLNYELRALLER